MNRAFIPPVEVLHKQDISSQGYVLWSMVDFHQPIGRYYSCIIDNIGKISLLSPAVYGQTTSCLILPVAKTGEQVS